VCFLGRLPALGAETEHRPPPVIDLHVDLAYQHGYEGQSFAVGTGQFRASELLSAGVEGVLLPLFIPRRVSPEGPRKQDLEAAYARVFAALVATPPYALPGCLAPAGRTRTWLAFEGAAPLADAPLELASWVARGVRSVGLVHTRANALASSSGDRAPEPFGLTERGRDLVRAAHALGVSIDVSHASSRALADVAELSRASGVPFIATHSNARALADHPRNLTDPELRAIAASGGVVGVNFHSAFLVRGRRATLADVVRHVRHLVRVMGVEHVAIGSDFEGDIQPPAELRSARDFPALARALERAGLSRDAVARIFAGNARRVLCRGSGLGAPPEPVYPSPADAP